MEATYYAHTGPGIGEDSPDHQMQPLDEHLRAVASMAEGFAVAGLGKCAYLLGLLHDIGKYQSSFQRRLFGAAIGVDHAVCGAKEVCRLFDAAAPAASLVRAARGNGMRGETLLSLAGLYASFPYVFAYAIAGHHSGLPDKGCRGDNADPSALIPRMSKETEDYSAYEREVGPVDVRPAFLELCAFFGAPGEDAPDRYEFLVRYLFSCLVDADFLDTERFVTRRERETGRADWDACVSVMEERFASMPSDGEVQQARAALRDRALEGARERSGVYLLDMPTGSGKTLCSMRVALELARREGKRRVIYVIPFTGVVEQTAEVFEGLFPSVGMAQHHSDFDFGRGGPEGVGAGRASENWDAPVVVTTCAQFFGSVYSDRPGKLRKIHNMAESVIVFDEAHTLPAGVLVPCLTAVRELTRNYGSVAVFLSATMPDMAALFARYVRGPVETVDLVKDRSLYPVFDNASITDAGEADLPGCLDRGRSSLVVCNTKRRAEDYFRAYGGDGYCLSTYMTPRHRGAVIGAIRRRLSRGDGIAVFSTSLVEAGVDLDFDCAWRELSGLDGILQTAGRCNREGRRNRRDSPVRVFRTGDRLSAEAATKAGITEGLMRVSGAENLSSPACVSEYYGRYYRAMEYEMDATGRREGFDVDFASIADGFRFYDAPTEGVVVPCPELADALDALRAGRPVSGRRFRRDTATVTPGELERLVFSGAVVVYDGVPVLEDTSLYDARTGIRTGPAASRSAGREEARGGGDVCSR